MTADTTRNGSSKPGLFKRATRRLGGSEGQAQDGRDVAKRGDHREYGGLLGDGRTAPADASFSGEVTQPFQMVDFDQPADEAELAKNLKHYTGRPGPRGKATRKRVGKVVPVAVVAAAIAAGTVTYSLSNGGQAPAAHLNSAMSAVQAGVSGTQASGANAEAASSGLLKVAKASENAARAAAKAAAKATPASKPAAAPTASATHAAVMATTKAATPSASASASTSRPAATTVSCNLSYSTLPENVTAIVNFLLAHGYSDNAAAGIAGNMYQESKGDPESVGTGGGGLIGWTPLPAGFVTGNPTADLQAQLAQVLVYNQIWSQFIPALNAAASPAAAADIYVTDFERAGIPAASNREASATNVASACGI